MVGIQDWLNKKARAEMTVARARAIVSAYGAILEKGPVPGTVADASELPFPKETIKRALILLLRKTEDPTLREQLKSGYTFLAEWQTGVGPVRLGPDVTNYDLSQGALAIAKKHEAEADAVEKWLAVADAEREMLARELEAREL